MPPADVRGGRQCGRVAAWAGGPDGGMAARPRGGTGALATAVAAHGPGLPRGEGGGALVDML
eukprot:7200197-Prorocentrum_lima.AAC.1